MELLWLAGAWMAGRAQAVSNLPACRTGAARNARSWCTPGGGYGGGRIMRILFLTHYFPPEGNAPASRVYEMSKRWVRDGHHVQVITCAPNYPDGIVYEGYANRLVQHEWMGGIGVTRIWTYLAPNTGTYGRIANYLSYMVSAALAAMLAKPFDVVIATSPQFFCGWAGVLVHKLARRPFILEIRDIWPEGIVTVGALSNRRVIRVLEALEVKLYRLATQIVAVGEGYKSEIAAKGIEARKIAVITNGADLDVYYPREPDGDLQSALGLQGKFVCSYNGNIGMTSGLDVVLRAARLLQARRRTDIQFVLVGDGAARKELEDEARRSALDTVLFVGRQAKDAMPRFLSISDVCLVHLKRRRLFKATLPSKMFEAMAMGKAIVLGVEGSAAEVLREADAGICIEPENEHALVEAIESLADDDERRAAYGRNGYEHVRRFYSRDMLAREYLRVIQELVGARLT